MWGRCLSMRVAVISPTVEAERLVDAVLGRETSLARDRAQKRLCLNTLNDAELICIGIENDMQDEVVELCRQIRSYAPKVVLLITHGDPLVDTAALLDAGSDDCIDLRDRGAGISRVAAWLRRTDTHTMPAQETQKPGQVVIQDGIRIDPESRSVTVGRHDISLTRQEFELLYYLARRPGAVMSRGRLMRDVWGVSGADENLKPELGRTVDTHVSLLRSKLGDRTWIETVRGVGFRFRTPRSEHRRNEGEHSNAPSSRR